MDGFTMAALLLDGDPAFDETVLGWLAAPWDIPSYILAERIDELLDYRDPQAPLTSVAQIHAFAQVKTKDQVELSREIDAGLVKIADRDDPDEELWARLLFLRARAKSLEYFSYKFRSPFQRQNLLFCVKDEHLGLTNVILEPGQGVHPRWFETIFANAPLGTQMKVVDDNPLYPGRYVAVDFGARETCAC